MFLSDFDYGLPKELIATTPAKPRDHSRLFVLDKKSGKTEHRHFYDIVEYFNPGDVLVLNNSKVFPARLIGKKSVTGGKIEIFLLHPSSGKKEGIWHCLLGGSGKKDDLEIIFDKGLRANILKNNEDGTWLVSFSKKGKDFMNIINKIGLMPLPPYIKRDKSAEEYAKNDKKNYQTVFADEKKIGSVAAPTAGLHFTPALIKKLKAKKVQIEYVTLHVGIGTFASIKTENIKEHKMHKEWIEIKKGVINIILKAKKENKKIIAVGTTSVRSLESVFLNKKVANIKKDFTGNTDIFIYPGFKFKIVDAMITNFHLPKSSLLVLVSAFAGKDIIKKAYEEAINKKYRFYSYGDAMLII